MLEWVVAVTCSGPVDYLAFQSPLTHTGRGPSLGTDQPGVNREVRSPARQIQSR